MSRGVWGTHPTHAAHDRWDVALKCEGIDEFQVQPSSTTAYSSSTRPHTAPHAARSDGIGTGIPPTPARSQFGDGDIARTIPAPHKVLFMTSAPRPCPIPCLDIAVREAQSLLGCEGSFA
eukprot:gene11830-biopygen2362